MRVFGRSGALAANLAPVGAAPSPRTSRASKARSHSRRGRRSYQSHSELAAPSKNRQFSVGAAPSPRMAPARKKARSHSRRGAAPTKATPSQLLQAKSFAARAPLLPKPLRVSCSKQKPAVGRGALAEATKPNVAVRSPFPPRRGGKGAGGIGGEKTPWPRPKTPHKKGTQPQLQHKARSHRPSLYCPHPWKPSSTTSCTCSLCLSTVC